MNGKYVQQAKVLINNYNWYYGPNSELNDVIDRDTEFRVYLNSKNTHCIFITNEKITAPDGSTGYAAIEFDILPEEQGADLPIVTINNNIQVDRDLSLMGNSVIKISPSEKPVYPKTETKNFDLLNLLSIVGTQLSKQQGFSGDYKIYVKDFYKQAVVGNIVIEKGDKQWIATARLNIDREIDDITAIPLDSLIEANTDRLQYFANQIKKNAFHSEVMKLPIEVPTDEDIYKP